VRGSCGGEGGMRNWPRAIAGLPPTICYAISVFLAVPAAAQTLEKVTVIESPTSLSPTEAIILGAIPNQLGYYKAEGLDVTIQLGNGPSVAAQVIQSGSAQFASTMPEAVLQIREQGGDVVAFYTMTQDNGVAVAVPIDSPIKTLEDLRGKSIGAFSWASGGGTLIARSLDEVGVKAGEYNKVLTAPGPATAAALKTKQLDALALWYSAYATMENGGFKFRYIDVPAGHRVAGYVMAVTDKFAREKPKAVEGYCRAINKAFLFARLNPDAAIDLFLKEYPSYKPANLSNEVVAPQYKRVLLAWLKTALLDVPVEGPAGGFSPDRWKFTEDFYRDGGQLKGTRPSTDGYTERFLGECNHFDRAEIQRAASAYQISGRNQ
jgi:NitT/TauT family transport system substrate-binding protein